MPKALNTLLIIAGALVIVGIVLAGAAFFGADMSFANLSTTSEFEECSYTASPETLDKIIIYDDDNSINFVVANDDKITVTYYENDENRYTISEEDKTLKMSPSDKIKWYECIGFNFNFTDTTITVAIPADYAGAIVCETSNGKITADSFTKLKEINFESSNGKIVLSSVDCTGNITLKTSNSSISVDDVTAGDFSANTSNGAINVDNMTAADLTANTSNGVITLSKVTLTGDTTLKNSNAKIRLDDVGVGTSLDAKTSNGSITGTILGSESDFSITSETSNGNNNLPEGFGSGDKRLDIETSNAEINITFVK